MIQREELLKILHRFSIERVALKTMAKKCLEEGEITKEDYIFIMNVVCGAKYDGQMYRK